jgi:hypothetical protein
MPSGRSASRDRQISHGNWWLPPVNLGHRASPLHYHAERGNEFNFTKESINYPVSTDTIAKSSDSICWEW